jgi:tetratricopeptide (TPR) repeat protein
MTTDTYESKMQRALDESAAGNFEQAVTLFQSAADSDTSTGVPYFLMGAAFAQAQQLDKAEAAYANALLLSPDLVTARFQLGLLQLSSGRAAISMLTWQPLQNLPADDPIRGYVLGYVALAQDKFQESIEHFKAGLGLPQDNQALKLDIEKTIRAIEQQRSQAPQQEPTPDMAEDSTATSHILLANYTSGSNTR